MNQKCTPPRTETIAIIGGGPAGGAARRPCSAAKQRTRSPSFTPTNAPRSSSANRSSPPSCPCSATLGIEDEVKSFSVHKPGATVCLNTANEVITVVFFRWADGPSAAIYAYHNTQRDLFDLAVLNAAEKSAWPAKVIPHRPAKLEKGDEPPDSVRLLQRNPRRRPGDYFRGGNGRPDLIVDAAGRQPKLISRLLETPIREGGRATSAALRPS